MLKVNLYNIKMILSGKNGINTILDNYETDVLEIFNTLEDIYTNYWQDGIALRFKDEMVIEKSNSLKFLLRNMYCSFSSSCCSNQSCVSCLSLLFSYCKNPGYKSKQ